MTELNFLQQIRITMFLISFSLGIIIFLYLYLYLPKFEKKHGVSYKGYRTFFVRASYLGVLGSLAVVKPGSFYGKKLCGKYKNTEYQKFLSIPHEELKGFKVSFWISMLIVLFMIASLLLLELEKFLGY